MTTSTSRITSHSAVQKAAMAFGAMFLLVGVLAKLLGIFEVSVLHNIVHLIFGVAGVLMARTVNAARLYLIGGGVIYAVLWLYGLVIDRDSQANFVPVNTADNWLHFVLALGMIALGVLLARRTTHAPDPTVPRTTQ